MIDCLEYRRCVLADPRDTNPKLANHLAGCRECSAYAERLIHFEGRLARALRVDTRLAPDALRAPSRFRGWPRMRSGRLAMAASVLIALVVAGSLWLGPAHSSLAADVVAHMAGEPQAWARTDVPVPSSELSGVLSGAHMRLRAGAGTVSYAQSCLFRGRHVPHLVVQTETRPVTVMVLVHETVSKPVPFDEEGYRGVIVPVPGHGSLAVLAQGQDLDLSALRSVAARVMAATIWTSG